MQKRMLFSVKCATSQGARVAPIEQQHIVWTQARERLKQHLSLSTIGAMHTGVKGEFSAG